MGEGGGISDAEKYEGLGEAVATPLSWGLSNLFWGVTTSEEEPMLLIMPLLSEPVGDLAVVGSYPCYVFNSDAERA